MKKIFRTFLFSIFILAPLCLPFMSVEAEVECPEGDNGYCMLSPIFAGEQGERVEMAEYLMRIYNALFLIAGIAATVIFIWGGFQYMTSEIGGKKSEAISMMQNAVYGLLLAIFSYTILYTINPNLLKVNFKLIPIKGLNPVVDPLSSSTPVVDTPSGEGAAWPDDSTTRAIMIREIPGIGFNNDNCANVGQAGCTSVVGISSRAVSKLKELQASCNCQITINGGTEYWLHGNRSTDLNSNGTRHRPNGGAVDLNPTGGVSNEIQNRGERIETTACHQEQSYPHYRYKGYIYVREPSHWHACYY